MESLSEFTAKFRSERSFFLQKEAQLCFSSITSNYLLSLSTSSDNDKITVFSCLRLLLRDELFVEQLVTNETAIKTLSEVFQTEVHNYLQCTENNTLTTITTELTNIFQKLAHMEQSHSMLLDYEVHKQLVYLVSVQNYHICHSSLSALINLCKKQLGREHVLDCYPISTLFDIISDGDHTSQTLACNLVLLLSQENGTQCQMKEQDLLHSCLTVIQSSSHSLLVKQRILESIERILDDHELIDEFRKLGGIPVVLLMIKQKLNITDDSNSEILKACFSLLTRLSLNDICATQIIDNNGLYLISSHLIDSDDKQEIQVYCMRTLRYLFSLERNRKPLKQLFPIHLFEDFINIGHYVHDLSLYDKLIQSLHEISTEEKKLLAINQESLNQNREPLCTIGEYAVLELLGSGAYGSVYKVRKGSQGTLLALKEIRANHPALGVFKTLQDKEESVGRLMNEVAMIHEKLKHPNIVEYYKCFEEFQHVYIEMSLIDGAPLSEFIASMKEKGTSFLEERIWNIFSQLICALRYLHEDKKIVHRDLKPANMMLGENDKLTITDFGLAKHQKEFSIMKSTVGTMLYWCPEIVESKEYDKKADIWASGCILYEMASLQPPFYATNMLSLAKKIAEVEFDVTPLQSYSSNVQEIVCKCLSADPLHRPDSIEIGSIMTVHLMKQLDNALYQCTSLEKKVMNERTRAVKQFQYKSNSSNRTESPQSSLHSPVTVSTLQLTSPNSPLNNQHLSRQRSYSLSPSHVSRRKSSLLSISPKHLREISDPVGDLLEIVHKIVHISQLSHHIYKITESACYLIVTRYKKIIFSENFKVSDLKAELRKIVNCLDQEIDIMPFVPHLLSAALSELSDECLSTTREGSVTYKQLNSFIEQVLKYSDYYK